MTGRRSNTGAQPTPLEETEPTGPAVPAPAPEPQPVPEPQPEADDSPPEVPGGFHLTNYRAEPTDGLPAETEVERIGRMVDAAVARIPRSPFGFLTPQPPPSVEDYPAPYSVQEAIQEVTRRVDAIEKVHSTEGGERYKYRGIDDVFAALHPLLGETGLVIMPGRMVEHRRETRQTAKGGTLNVAMVRVRYRVIGPDGSRTSGEAWGEAHDSGDKATQKALSQAYKSFTLQLFSIPTEASAEDDPDRTNEPGRPFTQEERDRAATAYDAATAADTLEKLVGVRHRAAALLDVPVLMADGRLVPLSLLFDYRREALEGAQS